MSTGSTSRFSFVRKLVVPAAGAATWVIAVVLAVAGYVSLGGSQGRGVGHDPDAVIVFAGAFATAALCGGFMTLAIGGRARWAVQIALSILALISLLCAIFGTLLWLNPSVIYPITWPNKEHFLPMREVVGSCASMVVSICSPVGGILGVVCGIIAGLLALLKHRAPKVTIGVTVAVLLALTAHPALIRSVAGLATETLLAWQRSTGIPSVVWVSDDEIPSAVGAAAGALVGALLGALGLSAGKPPSVVGAEPGTPRVTCPPSSPQMFTH